jgi:DNA-binding NarL/FixJ family response regulator
MSISVLVADDQELVRTGFRVILDSEPDIEVVGEAGDGREAVEAAKQLEPDVVLMDIRMPILDGLAATRRIVTGPDTGPRVLILTTFDLDEYVYEALRSGASGFMLKDNPAEQLIRRYASLLRASFFAGGRSLFLRVALSVGSAVVSIASSYPPSRSAPFTRPLGSPPVERRPQLSPDTGSGPRVEMYAAPDYLGPAHRGG